MERKQIRLNEQAERDIEAIQLHYGLSTRSAAIRFALREAARLIEQRGDRQSDRFDTAENSGSSRDTAG